MHWHDRHWLLCFFFEFPKSSIATACTLLVTFHCWFELENPWPAMPRPYISSPKSRIPNLSHIASHFGAQALGCRDVFGYMECVGSTVQNTYRSKRSAAHSLSTYMREWSNPILQTSVSRQHHSPPPCGCRNHLLFLTYVNETQETCQRWSGHGKSRNRFF